VQGIVDIKEMTCAEKYARILVHTKLLETFVPSFLGKHLGDNAIMELRRKWGKVVDPIPDNASDETMYEIGYRNWIRQWGDAVNFVRDKLGEEGVEQFTRADIDALKKENSGPALMLLKLARAFSPSYAFPLTAKQSEEISSKSRLAQFRQRYKRFPTLGMKVDVVTDDNGYWKIAL
jgi:hypothetical protein